MMGPRNYVFDIETVPLPSEQWLDHAEPFSPPANIKDPAKIEARRLEHQNRTLENAALSPLTGRVAAIGILGPRPTDCLTLFDEEEKLIRWFFRQLIEDHSGYWMGFNIANFDIPFLLKRAWKLGLEVPGGIVRGRYLANYFIDLAEVWRAGAWERDHISLDRLAKFLGLGQKLGTGAAFPALLYQDEKAAREYLERDLYLTWAIAERLGVTREKLVPGRVAEPEPEPEIEEPIFW